MTRLNLGLLFLVLVVACLSLGIGSVPVSPADSYSALVFGDHGPLAILMREIRLPRVILSVMVGFSLGLAGAACQGFLRNPLAEPGLIGVSSASALGAVLALQLGLGSWIAFAVPVTSLVFAAASVLVIFTMAGPKSSSLTLILSGIAISSLMGALTSLVLNLSPNPFAAMEAMMWLLGSLASRSFDHVWLGLPFMVIGSIILLRVGTDLDRLSLGEETAQSLGTNLVSLRYMVVLGIAAVVGAATSIAGVIGFVGLMVPHLVRGRVGGLPSLTLLPSGLVGALAVLLADLLVRLIAPGADLKLGVVTALIGAPFFLRLVQKSRSQLS